MNASAYMLWITVGAFVVLFAEIAVGRHKGIYQRKGEFPLLLIGMILGRFLLAPAVSLLVAALWAMLLPEYKGLLSGTPLWIALPGVLLFTEFFFYWVHRWAHRTSRSKSLLWMLHRTHHSATYMNVTVWMRLNLWWYVVIPNVWTMSLLIYLGFGEAAGIATALLATWNIVTHSDFRWDDAIRRHAVFGPVFRALEHVIVSPGIHHTHHGYGKDGASYRNFGVMLSFWDWVFGTLHIPNGRPHRYGLPGHDARWVEELLYPLVRIDAKAARRRGAETESSDDIPTPAILG